MITALEKRGIKNGGQPWLDSSVDQSIVPIRQGSGFHPWSGHIQESTNGCINKWNNKSIFFPFSLKSINKIFFKNGGLSQTQKATYIIIPFT